MRQFCFLYFHHRHSSLLSLPWKHNKRSQPKLTKISLPMLMTYQSPLLISPKKKTAGKRIIKARPCATSLDWAEIQTRRLSMACASDQYAGSQGPLKLQGRWGPWSFRGLPSFHKPCSLHPENNPTPKKKSYLVLRGRHFLQHFI